MQIRCFYFIFKHRVGQEFGVFFGRCFKPLRISAELIGVKKWTFQQKKWTCNVCIAALLTDCDISTYCVPPGSESKSSYLSNLIACSIFLFINSPSGQRLHPVQNSVSLPLARSLSLCQCDQFLYFLLWSGWAEYQNRICFRALSVSQQQQQQQQRQQPWGRHTAAKMSAGDVVCKGWLIKSPPEKKLKRFVSSTLVRVLCLEDECQAVLLCLRVLWCRMKIQTYTDLYVCLASVFPYHLPHLCYSVSVLCACVVTAATYYGNNIPPTADILVYIWLYAIAYIKSFGCFVVVGVMW